MAALMFNFTDAVQQELPCLQQAFDPLNAARLTPLWTTSVGTLSSQAQLKEFEAGLKQEPLKNKTKTQMLLNLLSNVAATLHTTTEPWPEDSPVEGLPPAPRYDNSVFLKPPVYLDTSAQSFKSQKVYSNKKRTRCKQGKHTGLYAEDACPHLGILPSPCLIVNRRCTMPFMSLSSKGYLYLTLLSENDHSYAVKVEAHRLVRWALEGMPLAAVRYIKHTVVMHLCNNARCLHPHHIQWGEHSDNLLRKWMFLGLSHPSRLT